MQACVYVVDMEQVCVKIIQVINLTHPGYPYAAGLSHTHKPMCTHARYEYAGLRIGHTGVCIRHLSQP